MTPTNLTAKPTVVSTEKLITEPLAEPPAMLTPKTTPKSRPQQKAKTRERIIHAGIDILSTESFKTFTMRGVAKRAKIAQPSFYNHFDNMEDLLETIIERTRTNFIDPQAKAMMSLSDGNLTENIDTIIYNFIRLAFDVGIQYPNFFCMTISERSLQGSPYGKIIHREFQNVRELYIKFFMNIARKQGVSVRKEKVALGVDAILGSNEALITGCIEGRYKNKEDAIAMAAQIIINQINTLLTTRPRSEHKL